MKALFIIDTLLGSGAERSLAEIALHFKKTTPVFVHIYKGDMLKPELEKSGVTVYSLDIAEKYGYSEAVKRLTLIYKKEKPDVVHSTLYKSDMIARKMKSRFPEIPLVGSFVNNSYTPLRYQDKGLLMKIKLWLAYLIDKRSAKKVDFFISNSETIKKLEGTALGIPQNKIQVIYRGRNVAKFENLNEDKIRNLKKELSLEGKEVLINVSRLINRKAQLDIVKALPKVKQKYPNVVLLLAGHGECEKFINQEAEKLNIADKIFLLGRRTDIPYLLALSDLFVYPSYAEGLPGALIEAMLSQKIIVASNIGENLECVDEETALIFNKGNVTELSEKIVFALDNRESLGKLAIEAKIRAKEKFQIQNIAQQYEKVYERLLSN